MALTTADYFWTDVFAQLDRQADLQIDSTEEGSGGLGFAFLSGLVEPQRVLQDLFAHKQAVQTQHCRDLHSALRALSPNDQTDPPVTVDELTASSVVRCFARSALQLEGAKGEGHDIWKKCLLDKPTADASAVPIELRGLRAWKLKKLNADYSAKQHQQIIQPMISSTVRHVSAPQFDLASVPLKELQRRLRQGEIAPRDEWIPSTDKRNKKTIDKAELAERLNFGEKLAHEGKMALAAGNTNLSLTLFTQGVHLLELYKCDDIADSIDLAEAVARFRRNKAIVDLQEHNLRAAIESTTACVEDNPNDGKARFLRGRALMLLGELEDAERDFRAVMTNAYCTDSQQLAATEALRQLLVKKRVNHRQIQQLIREINANNQWGYNHNPSELSTQPLSSVQQLPSPSTPKLQTAKPPPWQTEPLLITPEAYRDLLRDLLRLYTNPSFSRELDALRHAAEYDERQIIRKLIPFLPSYLEPIFDQHQIPGASFGEKKLFFDRLTRQMRHHQDIPDGLQTELSELISTAREILVGGDEVTG